MRSFNFGLSVLALAACTLHIGEKETESAGGTESATEVTGATDSSGETPTGSVTEQGSSTEGSTEGSTGPATGSTGDPTGSTDATTGGTTGEATGTSDQSSGATEDTGSTGGTSGGAESADATVDDSCGPADGPALEFRLQVMEPVCGAPWPGDVLRVTLFQGGPLAPGSYMIDGGNGFAWLQQGNQQEQTSDIGTITIESWDGELVSGSYDLPGLGLAGSFAGPHCPGQGMCG